jgi:phosphoglucosamine mutase
MSRRLFGTDGIRASFGDEPLTEPTVRRIGAALARHLAAGDRRRSLPLVAIGGDTRASTREIATWLAEGLAAGGAETRWLGVLPTPAIAWWTARLGASAGVAISASHNPAADNGIKLIDSSGFKWPAEEELALERRIAETAPLPPRVGETDAPPEKPASDEYASRYLRWLADESGGRGALKGKRIALDTANGAASALAGPLFRSLGAEVTHFFDRPDGSNINRGCGSTDPRVLVAAMSEGKFDLGFAFDGDADRCLLVDERGELRDGDAMLYLWATERHRRGQLTVPRVVATSMSNLGLERALAAHGIDVERCDVGDREVVAALRRLGLRLGGEQSGHLIDLHIATTGDGLLTAVVLAAILARRGLTASRALADFRRFPQVLTNVEVASKPALESLASVSAAVRSAEERLGGEGRLVLRYSGTEPLARVMIEGPDQTTIHLLAEEIAAALRNEIGARR